MEELVQQLISKAGISQAQAQQVVGVVSSFLKDKLPADVLNQVTGLLGNLGDAAGQAAGAAKDVAGQAAGAAQSAAGQAAGAAQNVAGQAAGAAQGASGAASAAADQAQDAAEGIMSKIGGLLGGDKN
jgi:hypothetical protein